MTKGELHRLERRVEELSEAIELCHPSLDADILENIHAELDQITDALETTFDTAVKRERRLKSVT